MTWHADTGILHRYARGELERCRGGIGRGARDRLPDVPAAGRDLRRRRCGDPDQGRARRPARSAADRTGRSECCDASGSTSATPDSSPARSSLETSWWRPACSCSASRDGRHARDEPSDGRAVRGARAARAAGRGRVGVRAACRPDVRDRPRQPDAGGAAPARARRDRLTLTRARADRALDAPFGRAAGVRLAAAGLALIGVALARRDVLAAPRGRAPTLARLWVAGATFAISKAPALTADAFARHFVVVQWPGQLICAAVGAGSIAVFATRRHTYEVAPMTSNLTGVELSPRPALRAHARPRRRRPQRRPGGHRPPRSERRRQDDAPADPSRPCSVPTAATSRSSGGTPRGAAEDRHAIRSPPRLPTPGARLLPRVHGRRLHRLRRRAEGDRRPHHAAPARSLGSSSSSASSARPDARSADSPPARAGGSPSPRRCSVGRSC